MGSRSEGTGPLGKIWVTDDDGHHGIGWTREEADEALREAQELNVEYVEKGVGIIRHDGTAYGEPLEDEEDR